MSVDLPHSNLSKGDQSVEQSDGALLVRKRCLGFGATAKLSIQVLKRVGASQRFPHRLRKREVGQQVVASLKQAMAFYLETTLD